MRQQAHDEPKAWQFQTKVCATVNSQQSLGSNTMALVGLPLHPTGIFGC